MLCPETKARVARKIAGNGLPRYRALSGKEKVLPNIIGKEENVKVVRGNHHLREGHPQKKEKRQKVVQSKVKDDLVRRAKRSTKQLSSCDVHLPQNRNGQ